MIAYISTKFATTIDSKWLSKICCGIIANGHYISCDALTQKLLIDIVNKEGSTFEKELIHSNKPFDFSKEEQTYMTTISLEDFSKEQCEILFGKASILLMENSVYEWDVYVHIIETYKRDNLHSNLIKKIKIAINNNRLSCSHGGGFSQYQQLIEQQEKYIYLGVGKYKICALLDSDRDAVDASIPKDKTKLCGFLLGETIQDIVNFDINKIYLLNQPQYVWHMWYKRAIENYFPNSAYNAVGMDTSNVVEECEIRDYLKLSDLIQGYSKDKLSQLTSSMSRNDYEKNLKHFNVNGEELSEIQLFLLKLVRII